MRAPRSRSAHAALALSGLLAAGCAPGLSPTDSKQAAIAAGTFVLGSSAPACADPHGVLCAGDRGPRVTRVSAFQLDTTEVSQLQYDKCVVDGKCPTEGAFDPALKDLPIQVDDPAAARLYCASRGMRLPTEAEFELAARMGADQMLHDYPWGDAAPTCDKVTFAGCPTTGLLSVGSNPGDVTAAGVHDLAGSVPEWVEDGYNPWAGCADRLSYGAVCWNAQGGCAESRCAADGAACAKGCMPPSDDVASVSGGDQVLSAPLCALGPTSVAGGMAANAIADPVLRATSGFGVIRGGSYTDGPCVFAGYARRHASPHRFAAGFRCAKSMDPMAAPTAPATYRFSLSACPADGMLKISLADTGGKAIDFTADVFVAGKPMASASSTGGALDGQPCSALFVLRPAAGAAAATVTAHVASMSTCKDATRDLNFTGGGDVPADGPDPLPMSCM